MPDLRKQLQQSLSGRVCLMGIGNVDLGDDGLGVRLAEGVAANRLSRIDRMVLQDCETGINSDGCFPLTPSLSPIGGEGARRSGEGGEMFKRHAGEGVSVMVAGTAPDRVVGRVAEGGFDHVVFLDAVEFGGAPGSVIFLDSEQMAARFPQVSTHKISLSVLARWIEARGSTRAWLLGVQPESLKSGTEMSPVVQRTLSILAELLCEALDLESRESVPSGEVLC